ncbi:UDP-glucose dehydrogenase family protein [Anaerobacillus sp. MEB173]|uniref:UDP-glucose dehydrogenase family protein n=1 Tax=Anaerobacillus sp. MEB173 TaxID=3383345 RepID=UPI003F8E6F39
MTVCIIGAGYVGLTTGAILANFGHKVCCVDINKEKIDSLNQGMIPIYEPGLEEIVDKTLNNGCLSFSTNIKKAIIDNEIIFIAVGTPSNHDGSPNLSYIHQVTETIAESINEYKTIIVKSTVPPGTSEDIHQFLLKQNVDPLLFDVVSNPEFLKEGTAIYDTLHPDKIVLGIKQPKPVQTLQTLYKNIQAPYIITSLTGAEMIKYASNAFLATKISFINEIARICDAYDVEVEDVALGIGTDPRIGPYFLKAGIGYGGSCLPKDLRGLHYAAKKKEVPTSLLTSVQKINDEQIDIVLQKTRSYIGDLKNKHVAVWGITFKPNTDDVRESPSLKIIKQLQKEGAIIRAYDPMAAIDIEDVITPDDKYTAVKGADAVIIATEWDEFKHADWSKVKKIMNGNVIIDGRNCIDRRTVKPLGFYYLGVGRS